MWFKHMAAQWYYIDPTQQYNDSIDWDPAEHDGSSINKADRELPAVLRDNTVYLIRRSNHQHVTDEGSQYPRIWCYNNSDGCELASGAMRVAIIGMPKQDDPVFEYMPEDAKTQWGPDASEWATLAQNYNKFIDTHFIRLNARDVVVYNLRIRTNSVSYSYGSSDGKGFIFANCENFEASKIYSCLIHGDILDKTDVTGTWFTSDNNDHHMRCPSLFSVEYTNTCHIHDCVLINKPDCYSSGHYIRLYSRFGNCSIHDIDIHNIPMCQQTDSNDTRWNHNGFFYIESENTYRSLSKVEVYNIHMYLFGAMIDTLYGKLRQLLSGQANLWSVHDITIEETGDANQLSDTVYKRLNRDYMLSLGAFNPGCIIEDITCNLPKCKGCSLLSYSIGQTNRSYEYFFTPKSQWHILRNISFIGVGDEDDVSAAWGSTNCTILNVNNDQYRADDYSSMWLTPTCDQVIVQNINIKSYYNTSTSGFNVNSAMLDMVNNHLQCKVALRKCTGKIGSIKTYDVSGAFTDSGGANLIYIGSITCNRNNPDSPYTGQQAIEPSWRSQILVGSTNTKFIRDNNFSNSDISNRNDHMYLCTSDTLEGNFVARNKPAKAETWSVHRTGGHSCTLRFICEVADIANYPLRIGDLPFAGIKRTLQKGINKCTFYMTTFGYNDSTQIKDKMRFRAKLPSGLYVGSNGEWSEDNETVWNNIELHTSYKYTFYIEMEEEGDVEFSYQFWWYMLGGYTYLDPFPAIELVE